MEFGGLKARGILSPSGRHNNSPAWSRHAAERWVKRRTYQNPERSERVAESAAKTLSQSFPSPGSRPSVSAEAPPRQDAVAGCHPLRYAPGFRSFFVPYPGFRRYRGCTLGYDYAALTGSNFRSPAARPIPIYCAEGGLLPMLLIFLFSTNSLGHV